MVAGQDVGDDVDVAGARVGRLDLGEELLVPGTVAGRDGAVGVTAIPSVTRSPPR